MMQTSFDANLVRAERTDVGVARALPLFNHENFLDFLLFNFFADHESGSLCASNGTSNLMIAFFHHCDNF